jgi:AraC-like DNA-binding protein
MSRAVDPAAQKRIFVQPPCAALRPFVQRLLVVESRAAHRDSHLPGTGVVAAFSIAGECTVDGATPTPPSAVTGLWHTARTHDHGKGHTVVLVEFTPVGAAALLRAPLDALANRTVELGEFLARGNALGRLHERLVRAPNHGRRVAAVEEFLTGQLEGAMPDPLITAAVAWIEGERGAVRIADVVRRIGLSQSALERRFRAGVGASPRRFASIVRLRHVARLRAAGHDFGTIAHAAGYHDQPHFNRDFKAATGVAPEEFFHAAGAMS